MCGLTNRKHGWWNLGWYQLLVYLPAKTQHSADESEAILRANALTKTYGLERSQVGAAGASTSAVFKLFKQKRDPLGDRGKMVRLLRDRPVKSLMVVLLRPVLPQF